MTPAGWMTGMEHGGIAASPFTQVVPRLIFWYSVVCASPNFLPLLKPSFPISIGPKSTLYCLTKMKGVLSWDCVVLGSSSSKHRWSWGTVCCDFLKVKLRVDENQPRLLTVPSYVLVEMSLCTILSHVYHGWNSLSGFVEEDSPYASDGQKGTYYFEFCRPLRTMDRIQQVRNRLLIRMLCTAICRHYASWVYHKIPCCYNQIYLESETISKNC